MVFTAISSSLHIFILSKGISVEQWLSNYLNNFLKEQDCSKEVEEVTS